MSDAEMLREIRRIVAGCFVIPYYGSGKKHWLPAPRKGTTKQDCYNALYAIQEILGTRSFSVMLDMAGVGERQEYTPPSEAEDMAKMETIFEQLFGEPEEQTEE